MTIPDTLCWIALILSGSCVVFLLIAVRAPVYVGPQRTRVPEYRYYRQTDLRV